MNETKESVLRTGKGKKMNRKIAEKGSYRRIGFQKSESNHNGKNSTSRQNIL